MTELEKIIRENLETKNPELDIWYAELKGDEEALKLLEKAVHLRLLALPSNQIQDISFLKNLNQLRSLMLTDNQITDLTPIQSLTQLEELYIEQNPIQNIEIVSNFSKIKKMGFSGMQLNNSIVLRKLNFLEQLTIIDVQTDKLILEDLFQLQEIELIRASINTLSFYNLPQLEQLTLQNLNIHQIEFNQVDTIKNLQFEEVEFQDLTLNHLPALTDIDIKGPWWSWTKEGYKKNTNRNLFFQDLPKIEFLDLSYLGFQKLTVANLPKLLTLWVSHNNIESLDSIQGLENLPNLLELDLGNNKFKEIAIDFQHTRLKKLILLEMLAEIEEVSLKNLTYSESLLLEAESIQKLSILNAPHLKEIIFKGDINDGDIKTTIHSFQGKGFDTMETLNLSGLELKEFSLVDMPFLDNLDLSENKLNSITDLTELPSLQNLYINENSIDLKDYSFLKRFLQLKVLVSDAKSLSTPPLWFAYFQVKGGTLKHYLQIENPPFIDQIWQLFVSEDEGNQELAIQLAKGQGWSEEEIQVYQGLIAYE